VGSVLRADAGDPGRPMGLAGRAAAVDQTDAFRGGLRRGGVRGTEGQVRFSAGRRIAGNCGSTRHYARGTHRLTRGSRQVHVMIVVFPDLSREKTLALIHPVLWRFNCTK